MVHNEKGSLGTKRVTMDIIMYRMTRQAQTSKDGLNYFLVIVLSRISSREIIKQVLEFLEIKIMVFT